MFTHGNWHKSKNKNLWRTARQCLRAASIVSQGPFTENVFLYLRWLLQRCLANECCTKTIKMNRISAIWRWRCTGFSWFSLWSFDILVHEYPVQLKVQIALNWVEERMNCVVASVRQRRYILCTSYNAAVNILMAAELKYVLVQRSGVRSACT